MSQVEVFRKQIQYYSYVAGVIILLIFGRMIGNNGIAYLAIAIETVALFMVVLGDNSAEVFGRMLRFRRKRKQFQDALVVKKRIMLLQMILGLVFFLIVFIFADVIAGKIFRVTNAGLIIRVMSPVIFLRMLSSLLTGYFQGAGAQMPAAFGSVLRQLLFLILGRLFCGGFLSYGEKVASLLKNEDLCGMYGAVGLAISIVVSEVVVLVALAIVYFLSDRNYDKERCEDGLHKSEEVWDTLQGFYGLGSAGMNTALVKRFFCLLTLIMITDLNARGSFYGIFVPIVAIPILLVGARFYALYARLVSAIKNKNVRMVKEKIQIGLQYAWSVGILIAVLLAVLAERVEGAYFSDTPVISLLLCSGCLLPLAVILLAYFMMIHTAHKKRLPNLLALLGSMLLYFGTMIWVSTMYQWPTAGVIAIEFTLLLVCTVLGVFTINHYRIKIDYINTFVIPLVCVAVVGMIVLFFGKLLAPHIGNGVTLWLGILLGIILYLVALGFTRVFGESEVEQLYGDLGKKILSVIFK